MQINWICSVAASLHASVLRKAGKFSSGWKIATSHVGGRSAEGELVFHASLNAILRLLIWAEMCAFLKEAVLKSHSSFPLPSGAAIYSPSHETCDFQTQELEQIACRLLHGREMKQSAVQIKS